MEKLRIGIIGTGGISNSHVKAYQQMEDVEIVAGADIVPGKAGKPWTAGTSPRLRPLRTPSRCWTPWSWTRSACAPTTPPTRSAPSRPCGQAPRAAGKAHDRHLRGRQAVRRVEKETGKILTIGFQPRYDGRMRKIKEIVQSGQLGKVYYIQTGGGRRRGIPGSTFIEKRYAGVGALADIGCYSLDMVLNALGYPKPLTVSAVSYDYFGKNPKYTPPEDAARFSVDDFCGAFIRLEGGITLDFRMSWAMHMDTTGSTIFLGTDAGLKVEPPTRSPCGRRLGRQLRQRHLVPRRLWGGHQHPHPPARRQGGPLLSKMPRLCGRHPAGVARAHPHQ